MARTDDNLLDLSAWPASSGPASRPGLPTRPTRRPAHRFRVLLTPLRGALAAGVLGAVVLLVPVGRCGNAIGALTADERPAASDTPPALDGRTLASDQAAVDHAEAAMHAAAAPSPRPAGRPASVHRITTKHVDASAVSSAQADVVAARRDVDSASADLNRLLGEQQSSSDPASYDDAVAAAQARLDEAQSALDDAERALAAARAGTTTTAVVRASGAPSPAASPADSTELAQELVAAKQTRAAHLAQQQKAVAAWRAGYRSEAMRVAAFNSRVRSCAARAGVPGWVGSGLVLSACALGVFGWTRRGR